MSPFDLGLIAAAVVAFVFSFFDYYKATLKGDSALCNAAAAEAGQSASVCNNATTRAEVARQIRTQVGGSTDSGSAWHGFFGWFGVVLLLVGALAVGLRVLAPQIRLQFPPQLIALVLGAVGLVSTIVALFVIPADHKDEVEKVADLGHGFGYFVVLVAAIVFVVLAALRFMQTKKAAPPAGPGYGYAPPPPSQGPPPQGPPPQGPPPGGYGQPPQGPPPQGYGR